MKKTDLKILRQRIALARAKYGDAHLIMSLMTAGAGRSTAENLVAGRYWHKPSSLLRNVIDRALNDGGPDVT